MTGISEPINGDMASIAVMNTDSMAWQPSPSDTVWRKRLHLVGGAESGQLTSIVRYDPGSRFPAHDHPEGEEILVLSGTFSDEHGNWPEGTHLLNPEGFRHAPFSEAGCVLFVKLRQYAGEGRTYRKTDTKAMPWLAQGAPGIEVKRLFENPRFPDVTRLERWAPDTGSGVRPLPGGCEIFVVEGGFEDVAGRHEAGTWLRLPAGARLDARSTDGCVLYVKSGGVSGLRSA